MRTRARTFLRIAMAADLLVAALIAAVWIVSEFQKVEFAINWRSRYALLEFAAVQGAFYVGCQHFGAGYIPFMLPMFVALVWPLVALANRFRRPRRHGRS
jgi:hypothetical protein